MKLVSTAAGVPTEFDGCYVVEYDPTYVHPQGYDGGILRVTANRAEAMRFETIGAALELWRKSYGNRADGEPNRPLTAWSVMLEHS